MKVNELNRIFRDAKSIESMSLVKIDKPISQKSGRYKLQKYKLVMEFCAEDGLGVEYGDTL